MTKFGSQRDLDFVQTWGSLCSAHNLPVQAASASKSRGMGRANPWQIYLDWYGDCTIVAVQSDSTADKGVKMHRFALLQRQACPGNIFLVIFVFWLLLVAQYDITTESVHTSKKVKLHASTTYNVLRTCRAMCTVPRCQHLVWADVEKGFGCRDCFCHRFRGL